MSAVRIAFATFIHVILLVLIFISGSHAETVYVKYRGHIDLMPFICMNVVSSFVLRVC